MIPNNGHIDPFNVSLGDILRQFVRDNLKTILIEDRALLTEVVRDILLEDIAPNPTTLSKLLDRREAAGMLGISLPTLDQYTKEGIIKGKKVGSRTRYSEADLLEAGKEISSIKYKKRYDLSEIKLSNQ